MSSTRGAPQAADPDDTRHSLSDLQAQHLLRLIHWMGSANRQLRRKLAEVAAHFALSDTELLVVWLCCGNGRIQVELAGALGISPAQMSGLVERLRTRGLVAVHRLAVDRRRQVWRTTAAGMVLLEQVARHLDELVTAVTHCLRLDEQQAVVALCERLAEALAAADSRGTAKPASSPVEEAQYASKEAA